ncbi:MAG: ras guanine nucleotide exchange factor domain-containing protein [Benjaminiella poitrasii]|nr:MAG: ras guanine nucleotide exchange factor domain-containing protein [Benjaminiella poitrasii]
MSPLALLSPLSTENTMQALMSKASDSSDCGQFKMSYDLYIEALLSALKEFKQLEFVGQSAVSNNDLSSVFGLAHVCLRHARSISSNCTVSSSPPPVPPKPKRLSANNKQKKPSPPPLPARPKSLSSKLVKKKLSLCNLDQTKTVNTKELKEKAASSSLKTNQNHSRIPRRSLTTTSAHTASIKTFLSLSSVITQQLDSSGGTRKEITYPSMSPSSSTSSRPSSNSSDDSIFLLSNSTIDPHILITVQTSNNDNSLSSNHTDNGYSPMIPQAPLITTYKMLQKQLEEAVDQKHRTNAKEQQPSTSDLQSPLNRVRNIYMSATTVPTILQFSPVLIAYQLTIIDSTIFRNIPVDAILTHTPKTPHTAIVASTDFFNYLTRLIEHTILLQQDASGRAEHINHWVKVANTCFELKNYQTLKAVISALGTPPIQRLKRSWQFVPKKSLNVLETLSELMSEASNYGKYRAMLGLSTSSCEEDEIKTRESVHEESMTTSGEATARKNSIAAAMRKNSFSEPTVPFLGIFIHDITYLVAALLSGGRPERHAVHNSDWIVNRKEGDRKLKMMQQDARVSELLRLFKNFQRSPPYSPHLSAACLKDLNKNRKRKLSHALTRGSAMKKTSMYFQDDGHDGELCIEMQQCLVTQYLLTRSWVSEKTVDELSLIREPTKLPVRNHSVPDLQPSLLSSGRMNHHPTVASFPSNSFHLTSAITGPHEDGLRNSSGSLTSNGDSSSSSNNSRPVSIDEEIMEKQQDEHYTNNSHNRKLTMGNFWIFGRKSADQGFLKTEPPLYGVIQRSPRHFSFGELNGSHKDVLSNSRQQTPTSSFSQTTCTASSLLEQHNQGIVRVHREGSLLSAASFFRKDFWKGTQHGQQRTPLISFNSDPSMLSDSEKIYCTSDHERLDNDYMLSSTHPLDVSFSSSTE